MARSTSKKLLRDDAEKIALFDEPASTLGCVKW